MRAAAPGDSIGGPMHRRLALAVMLAAALGGGGAAAQEAAGSLRLAAGETALEINRHLLEDLGIELRVRQTVGEAGGFTRAVFPVISPPSLRLRAPGASFEGLGGGALRHQGGFELSWRGGGASMVGFELVPAAVSGWSTALFDLRAADGFVPFFLDGAHHQHLADLEQFVFLNMDLRLTEELARRIGRPEMAGLAVGSADVRTGLAEALAPHPELGGCVPDFAGDVDVELVDLYGLGEVHHEGGRVAMAASAKLRNSGTADVEWYRPIDPDGGGGPGVVGPHPYLAMSLYRLAGGALRQIGRADVKHAFYATNDDCGCQGDQILYDGCTDLYAAVTNQNRTNLAPRHEVTASTGAWESLGSHFDGDPVDDFRHHYGEGDHPDEFEHRLTVAEDDLMVPGARYFIEAWYVAANDVDLFNSMGRREVAPQLTTGWSFPIVDGGMTRGPAIDAWIDRASPPPGAAAVVLDTGEGRVELAGAAAARAAGVHRYDYGLMNFDFDRRLRSLSVPLPAGVKLAGVTFHDGDDNAANDWQSTVTATEITWSTPAGAPALGALDWGTLYSFGFEANAAPAAADPTATMEVLEAGSPTQLTAASKGPGSSLAAVNRLDVAPAGSGLGTVVSTPAGIGCGPDCDELYAPGTPVQLTGTADPGSALIRWIEGGTPIGTADTQDTVLDMDRSLVAVFELCDRQLPPRVVTGPETFEACEVLRAGTGFEIAGTGDATLRAGGTIVLEDGFFVAAGGELTLEIDPTLLP